MKSRFFSCSIKTKFKSSLVRLGTPVGIGMLSVFIFLMAGGCAVKQVDLRQALEFEPQTSSLEGRHTRDYGELVQQRREGPYRTVKRVITEKEIASLHELDPQLTRLASWEILGRVNTKSALNVSRAIKSKAPLKVPADFKAYKNWTPLPETIVEVRSLPKFILIVKDIPFVGWYEKGHLVEDSQICIGKQDHWTKNGLYNILEKDKHHISQSYSNAMGAPAPMPLALKVYGNVWIHAGDVMGGYYSHGCVNLPWAAAEELFHWAEKGTPVLIVSSLKTLNGDLKKYSQRLQTLPSPSAKTVSSKQK